MFKRALPLGVIGLCAIVLTGCGRSDEGASQSGQVVARVGTDVITTQELDNEFRLANVPNDKRKDPETVKRVLGEAVARKYLARQALNAKLDREPAVLLDVLRSKEQVLASAMLARNVNAKVSAITKADVDKYITNNPQKFANREILRVEEIVMPLGSNLQGVLDATRSMSSLDDVDRKLTELGMPHNRSMGSLNTAELPDELANNLKTRNPDDIIFARTGQNGAFLKVQGRETQPLTGAAAEALARQLMRLDIVMSEAALASFSGNMEAKYEGDYGAIMAGANASPGQKQ
jgi:EpsD family peptidyl-prolyl cis-trans isomerase